MEVPVAGGVGAGTEAPSIPTLLAVGDGERRRREREEAVARVLRRRLLRGMVFRLDS
ncbi:hypothetical protein K435DRAFT_777620 [Dendrothele bispora CBS 962.96]|uniref:Uncharacterized protein n=1 Tax=Dendrothele bispora (strain CBS 962.96) TaxID=1314807 RepID=A0A4S8M8D9_DENBC|nr:hypothetical protein K435DRAFT_777620 [Dendrothele bispora CBS 962.96]